MNPSLLCQDLRHAQPIYTHHTRGMSLRTATRRRFLMCPPPNSRWSTRSTRGWTRPCPSTPRSRCASGSGCARPTWTSVTRSRSSSRCRACPTWCSRRTADSSSTAGSSGPTTGTTAQGRGAGLPPVVRQGAGYDVVRPSEAIRRRRGLHLRRRHDPGRHGLSDRPRCTPRGGRAARPPRGHPELIDPRFLPAWSVALAVLDDSNVMYYPGAFSEASRATLADLFPDAVIATEADALAMGLNAVSDGVNVVIASAATELADQARARLPAGAGRSVPSWSRAAATSSAARWRLRD